MSVCEEGRQKTAAREYLEKHASTFESLPSGIFYDQGLAACKELVLEKLRDKTFNEWHKSITDVRLRLHIATCIAEYANKAVATNSKPEVLKLIAKHPEQIVQVALRIAYCKHTGESLDKYRMDKICRQLQQVKRSGILRFSEITYDLENKNLIPLLGNILELAQAFCTHTVRKLYLRRNDIKKLPDSIKLFTHIHKLNVSCNKLTSIPKTLFTLPELAELYISDNQITTLDGVTLPSLRKLVIKRNNIVIMGCFTLPKLLVLECEDNRLFPLQGISQAKSLHPLCISHNRNFTSAHDLKKCKKLSEVVAIKSHTSFIEELETNVAFSEVTIVKDDPIVTVNDQEQEVEDIPLVMPAVNHNALRSAAMAVLLPPLS